MKKNFTFKLFAIYFLSLLSFNANAQYWGNEKQHSVSQTIDESKERNRAQLFYEDWISESFSTNGWTFDPSQGNWIIDLTDGNPLPSAKFHYQPMQTNYSFSIVSPLISTNGSENLTLTFDLLFSDYASAGNEHLKVWVWNDTYWELVSDFSSTGSFPWTTFTYSLSGIENATTQLKFEATGLNSDNINNWNLDNIELTDVLTASFELTPLSYDFGQVPVDSISDLQTFTMSNTGVGAISVTTVMLDSTDASEFILNDNNTYPLTINEGDSAQVTISFSPQSIDFMTAILVVTTDIGMYQSLLTGEGYNNQAFALTPLSYDFGQIMVDSTSDPHTFTLSNIGVGAINVSTVTLDGIDASEFNLNDSNTYPLTINDGDSAQVTISFSPLSADFMTANLVVTTNIGVYESSLSGEGYNNLAFELTPLSYDFEQILVDSTSDPQTFTLSNIGGGAISVSSVTLNGVNASEFILNDSNDYPLTINEGDSAQVTINFSPQSTGTKIASLVVTTEIGDFEASLTGNGYVIMIVDLPFVEDWISEDFTPNGWTFDPSQGNWIIDLTDGNPLPSAKFHYQPMQTNYSFSLVSPLININGSENLTLTFDLLFMDYATTGNEHFKVWIWNDTYWELVTDFSSTGSFPWTTFTYSLSGIENATTQLKFEATGLNSDNINNWNLDNISISSENPFPEISVSPTSLFQELGNDSTATKELYISNLGLGMLEFQATIEYSDTLIPQNWLTISPATDTLNPSEEIAAVVTFNTQGLEMDQVYEANIIIESNDPVTPTVIIPVTLSIIVGIANLEISNPTFYPNPARDFLLLSNLENTNRISIVDLTGKVVFVSSTKGQPALIINLDGFKAGIYLLQFDTLDHDVYTQKFIINK